MPALVSHASFPLVPHIIFLSGHWGISTLRSGLSIDVFMLQWGIQASQLARQALQEALYLLGFISVCTVFCASSLS